ncbi:CELLULOSE SYNTHASE INTERACTIVE 3 [Rhynchospora pubera]|uniref:CELLULOSE SYNTHASE INTERACTIVE 3 n=1 Tax=Rhynchospora pubera TaxID=906938 RepID=A0AAV8C0C1_9POAL|nr:CELLULOSE SYNTHASE INTERACTIVE 3 [Rhynchospora pubera]
MAQYSFSGGLEPNSPVPSSSSQRSRETNGLADLEDPESAVSTVARTLEQLHISMSSPLEREQLTTNLLSLAREKKEARFLIGTHAQAMPLFISILRNGPPIAKFNVASLLSAICKEEELRVRVLLGGCIPPLLAMLKSDSVEGRKVAAEAIFDVSSGSLSDDHIGMKIFVTEGVVPTLWAQLSSKIRQEKEVEGYLTGALRNLCRDKDGYWRATLEAGGVEIITDLLSSGNPTAQSNSASLLARLVSAFGDSVPKVIDAGAIRALIRLLGQENDISARASAADALEVLSLKSTVVKKAVVDAGGLPILIGSIVAPSKECMQGGDSCSALQSHSVRALSNICGGMTSLILYLGEVSTSHSLPVPLPDILGALAYALMVFVEDDEQKVFDPVKIETTLIALLKPRDRKLVQDRILEALASLYSNSYLYSRISNSVAKRVLIGLITIASAEIQEHLIPCLTGLCCEHITLWDALGKREGVQLLISLLGLSSEQQQEYAVSLLAILTDEIDESKWAITAAGGIPPLVQLLEIGSTKARQDAAHVLLNLCCHSDDIRACVESAGAVSSLLWLLKSGGSKGQEASAKALKKLIGKADPSIINQLLVLLSSEFVGSKSQAIMVLGHVLVMASHNDLVRDGSPANKGLRSLIQVLNSSDEEMHEHAASALADLFSTRPDICGSLATDEVVNPCMKLLTSSAHGTATQSARALGAFSRVTNANSRNPYLEKGDVIPLIRMANAASMDSAETAVAALANLLSDINIAQEALDQDIIDALKSVLKEGNSEGKRSAARCLYQLLNHFPLCNVLTDYNQCRFVVHLLVDWLIEVDMGTATCLDALAVLSIMVRTKESVNFGKPVWAAIAEMPEGLFILVKCLDLGLPNAQDKVIEILSRVCQEQASLVGQYLGETPGCVLSLSGRVVNSPSLEVRIGGAGLLTCAIREKRDESVRALYSSELSERLVGSLVDMMRRDFSAGSLQIEVWNPKSYAERDDNYVGSDPAKVLGSTAANWLLLYLCSACAEYRVFVMEAGGIEVISDQLSNYTDPQVEYEEIDGIWKSALLLSVLFQDQTVIRSSSFARMVPYLVSVLKSDELADRFFSAQVLSSLVQSGDKGIQLLVANSGAIPSLITLIGYTESNLTALAEEFILPVDPSYAIMKIIFELEEVVIGATARKSIHFLVDLLRPMADRPGAPLIALELLTCLAEASDMNKVTIAESGAIDALTKYLSLSPQNSTETAITNLLAILYTNPELLQHESSLSTLNQLLAVLRLGSRNSRLVAARALKELFQSESLRDTEMARQAIQPLVDMLTAGNEREQQASLSALIKLTAGNLSKASALTEVGGDPLDSLCKILSFSSSLELKKDAAQLCCILFQNPSVRDRPAALECIQPLTQLVMSGSDTAMGPAVSALDLLLEDEDNANVVASNELVDTLVRYISPENFELAESSLSALIKLGKDRPNCKIEMINSGVIDSSLDMILEAPATVSSLMVELFRILTNNSGIARSAAASRMVEPLFLVLQRPDFTVWGQHSALQALINILEKPQSLKNLKLTPSQVIEPLIIFLESPSPAIQQLGTEVLMHLLEQEHFKIDITTLSAVVPLVRLAGIGIISLQQTAIRALESISVTCPKAVADAGGIFELSKVIVQDDPLPSQELWESAALVLSNVLRSSTDHYVKISMLVLVRLLNSSVETTVTVALSALLVQQKNSTSSAVSIAEAGAVEALLELLKLHQCEEAAARLLEALFNNVRVREKKIAKYAIEPLAQYLLDPQTRCQPAKLLVTLSLGDLFQHEALSRSRDSVSACRALVSVLEDQPNEDITIVAICALQSLVMNSRTNRRAVAESGGILIVQELLLHPSAEVAAQAASLIKYLFSNHTLQEYVSNELIRSLTAALEKELLSTSTINEEVLRTIYTIFSNFKKLRMSEAATLCIPHLVAALNSGSEPAQEAVLDTLCLLKDSWPQTGEDIAKAQALIAAEAIPVLQLLIKNCPPSFHERVDSLLHCLPGCLTVTVKRGNNLKQTMTSTNAFCCLKIGMGPPKETRVVNHCSNPEWKEAFTWAFDVPPKGQKLYIICKSKSTFGKSTLGRVTIQIDKVLTEGIYSGQFSLSHDGGKDSSRTLEIEIVWSNRTSGSAIE